VPFPHSTERFLTTHTGSLPRPADLIRTMYAKEEGVPVDAAALDARIRAAVAEVVGRQVEAGVDLVNDGERTDWLIETVFPRLKRARAARPPHRRSKGEVV